MKKIAKFAAAALIALGVTSNVEAAPNTITGFHPIINPDGMADYSFSAHEANIVKHFDPNTRSSYLTGYLDGDYQVKWTGGGVPNITGGHSSFVQTGPGTGIFKLRHDTPNAGGYFTINPGGVDLNTLEVWSPDRYQNTSFRTPFIQKYQRLAPKALRFMDWMQTNGSPVTDFVTRNTSWTNVGAAGMKYEQMFELAKILDTDVWINVPTGATADWGNKMADLAKTLLPANRNVRLEWSNEPWNTGMTQYAQILTQARANPAIPNLSDYEKTARHSADRLKFFTDIFRAKLGVNRVTPELGGFIANPYWGQWQAEQLKLEGVSNPGAAGYRIGMGYYAPGSPSDVNVQPGDSLAIMEQKVRGFMNGQLKTWLQQNKDTASFYGMTVDAYEAAVGSSYVFDGNPTLVNQWISFNNNQLMYQLEADFIKQFKLINPDGDYTVFGMISPESQWGQWGLFNDANASFASSWKALGVESTIDTTAIPEPASLGLIGVFGCLMMHRRFRRVNA
jgi:hypothetical protein